MLKIPFFFKPMESAIAVLQDNIFGDTSRWENSFVGLSESLPMAPTQPIIAERRREPRFLLSLPVQHRIQGDSTGWKETQSLDVSQNGIRLALNASVGVGTHLELHLKLPNVKQFVKMKGVVVWEKPSLNGQASECGVAFEDLRRTSTKGKIINFMADKLCEMAMKETYHMNCRPASSEEDIQAAFKLVYQEYLARNYCKANAAKMFYTYYCMLPNCRTFLLEENQRVVGTISLIVDSACGIPMETLFQDKIQRFRRTGRKIAEVSLLALDHNVFGKKSFALTDFKKLSGSFLMFKLLFDYAYLEAGVTDLFIAMHPRHKELYQYLTFEVIGPVRGYPGAEGNPALPMHLDVGRAILTVPRELNLARYFLDEETPKSVLNQSFDWNLERARKYLFEVRDIWSHLSAETITRLHTYFPEL